LVDAAIISTVDPNYKWKPVPKVAVDPEDVINNAGTKYTSCPMLIGLREAVRDMEKMNVAFVGTGCTIEGIRKSRFLKKDYWNLGQHVKLAIGLFCMESFSDKLLREYLPKQGVNLEEVTKFHISKGSLILFKGDTIIFKVPVKILGEYATEGCHVCVDSTAEFADISVGGIGSEPGWSSVFIRSRMGELFFERVLKSGCIEAKPLPPEGLQNIIKFQELKIKMVQNKSKESFPKKIEIPLKHDDEVESIPLSRNKFK
jgi:coenzyme F420 hydrogenase subunit beta